MCGSVKDKNEIKKRKKYHTTELACLRRKESQASQNMYIPTIYTKTKQAKKAPTFSLRFSEAWAEGIPNGIPARTNHNSKAGARNRVIGSRALRDTRLASSKSSILLDFSNESCTSKRVISE